MNCEIIIMQFNNPFLGLSKICQLQIQYLDTLECLQLGLLAYNIMYFTECLVKFIVYPYKVSLS